MMASRAADRAAEGSQRKVRGFAADEARRDADHVSFLKHRRFRWLKIALLVSLLCAVGYAIIEVEPRHNGGSWYGYTLGTMGALLIVWLSLLGIRKRRMTPGAWSLKAWTSAHVYLGLALIVIGTLHTGFQFGWNLHTLAYGLMLLVIASGIWGAWAYATLPAALSDNRQEMTKGQMLEALDALDRQLESAAQPLDRAEADAVIAALEQDIFAVGVIKRLSGRDRACKTQAALGLIARRNGQPGAEASERVLGLLEKRRLQLSQIRRHMRLRALLELWLYLHVPATIALIAALAAHIIAVFYYW